MKKILITLIISSCLVKADDWKTTDGKVYQSVKVVKVETDCVTILDSEGGARIPLEKLPPEIQKQLNYDPIKAKMASDERLAQDKINDRKLEKERAEADLMRKKAFMVADNQPLKPVVTTSRVDHSQEIQSLQTQIAQMQQEDLARFNAPENVFRNQRGEPEHKYGMSHNPQIDVLQQQIAQLEAQ